MHRNVIFSCTACHGSEKSCRCSSVRNDNNSRKIASYRVTDYGETRKICCQLQWSRASTQLHESEVSYFLLDRSRGLVVYYTLLCFSSQALSNITEVPKGKLMLLKVHSRFIEDIDTSHDEAIAKHKNILLKIIHSRPWRLSILKIRNAKESSRPIIR